MTEPAPLTVAIAGAGPVGLTLASALASGAFTLHLIDRPPPQAANADPRALALAAGSRQLLNGLGAWPDAATAITDIHVDQHGTLGHASIRAAEKGVVALGHVVRYGALITALEKALPESGIVRHSGEIVAIREADSGYALDLHGATGRTTLTADLVIHAEGKLADTADVAVRPYGQTAIVAEIASRETPSGRAFEHFTPSGPLALLPLPDRWSLVLTVKEDEAPALLALDDSAFIAAVQQRFGHALQFTAVSPRHAYPLALRQRRRVVAGNQVWIGNAAQTLHPVAGQGFNLGLRDACALAEALIDWELSGADRHCLPSVLAAYAARRRVDRGATIGITDALVRLFSTPDFSLLRGLGLTALDLLPPAKNLLARHLMFGSRS